MRLNIKNRTSISGCIDVSVPYCMATELIFFPNTRSYLLNGLKNRNPNKDSYYILYDSISNNATFISYKK